MMFLILRDKKISIAWLLTNDEYNLVRNIWWVIIEFDTKYIIIDKISHSSFFGKKTLANENAGGHV